MSIEIEVKDSPESKNGSPAPQAVADVNANATRPTATSAGWRRGWFSLAAGVVVALVVAGIIGNNVIARQYTPEAAVRAYLSALQSADASATWNDIEVLAPNQPVAASLTAKNALEAALKASPPDISSFDIVKTSNADDTHAVVAVAIANSKGRNDVTFPVDRSGSRAFGLYPTWRVVVAPAVIAVTVAKGGGGIAVDGNAVTLPAGTSKVAVLPLGHRVDFAGTALMAPQSVAIDASAGGNALVYKPHLTSAGMGQAAAAVNAYFSGVCTKITSPNPESSGCPQSIGTYLTYPGAWQQIGDPGQALTVAIDAAGNVSLGGFYQMVFAYTEGGITGTVHVPAGGAFSAAVSLTDSGITITSVAKSASSAAISRPTGANDQDAIALVAKGMAACANVSAETVGDCPQAAPDVIIQNVRWKLNGDPTSGATVRFDGTTGMFIVHGNFSTSVVYTWFGNARNRSSSTSAYDAYLFWNGQALQLVTIQGANS